VLPASDTTIFFIAIGLEGRAGAVRRNVSRGKKIWTLEILLIQAFNGKLRSL